MNLTTTREFWKHKVFGEIFAVEYAVIDGQREVLAASPCTRPEELTGGALPVLPLDNGHTAGLVRSHVQDYERWEPPMADTEKLAAIFAAEADCQQTQADVERAHKTHAAAKKAHDKALDDLRRVVREASDAAGQRPLLAIAERPEAPPDSNGFDAELGRFDDGDDGSDGAADPDEQHPQ